MFPRRAWHRLGRLRRPRVALVAVASVVALTLCAPAAPATAAGGPPSSSRATLGDALIDPLLSPLGPTPALANHPTTQAPAKRATAPAPAAPAPASPATPATPAPASPATASPATPATPAPATPAPVDCSAVACVALTFDDGPGPFTARLLDELGSAGARATFFVLGMNAQSHPDLVQRMLAGGMTVASHTWDHRDMRRLSDADARAEVDRTSALLASLGVPATGLLRPPFGAFCPATRTLGQALVLWDVDTEDWRNRDIGTTTARALATARPGSMILLHDVQASTVAAVPGIVEQLRARGLTLVTVPELLGPTQPGGVYFRRA